MRNFDTFGAELHRQLVLRVKSVVVGCLQVLHNVVAQVVVFVALATFLTGLGRYGEPHNGVGVAVRVSNGAVVYHELAHVPPRQVFAFGLDLSLAIALSNLPVVGSRLPKDLTLEIENLQLIYSSQLFPKTEIGEVNSLLPATVTKFPVDGLSQGINFSADLPLAQGVEFG